MRVFIFESITGGGTLGQQQTASVGTLLMEGRAMLTAVASDFAKLNEVKVICLWDARLPIPTINGVVFEQVHSPDDTSRLFDFHVSHSDKTLLIAPELNGELLSRTRRVEELGGQLLSPDAEFVQLTSSKSTTAQCLSRAGVQVPATALVSWGDHTDLKPPLVVKPDDGAGSMGVTRIDEPKLNSNIMAEFPEVCVQEFCPGQPTSVTVLCGQSAPICFPACRQILQAPGFQYTGGSIIGDTDLSDRAANLARKVVDALPSTRGLIGVDMILGERADGSNDYAIEVNPRLTTSYVGLRHVSDQNLAHAMVAASAGKSITLSFQSTPLEFSASGEVS